MPTEEIDIYHPEYPEVDIDTGLFLEKPPRLLAPKSGDYKDVRKWQADHDKWYKKYIGSCLNFAGHF